jgi:hypothetical protein
MVFLLAYAMVVWAIAIMWRRRWQAFAATFLSIPPVVGITHLTVLYTAGLEDGPHTWIYPVGFAYAGLILGVGLLIAVQPRNVPETACPMCQYDAVGIDETCPECGASLESPVTRSERLRQQYWRAEREAMERHALVVSDPDSSEESRRRLINVVRGASDGPAQQAT